MARIRAPELAGAGGWIGTAAPLSLTALAGKIVVLEFWTSCCINCVRVIEELRPIGARFADEAVVIGIHSPKFPHEHDHTTVERAVARLRLSHPVLDDPDLTSWQLYGVRGWPTVVVVDPEGYVVGGISGEGCAAVLTETIQGLIATHSAGATLVRGPVAGLGPLAPSLPPPSMRALDYPGKVAVEPGGGRLAIADTGHDRVVLCDLEGRVESVHDDLHQPQGVRFDGDRLIVCDTGADRVVALALDGSGQTVLAGGIASPWDVVVDRDGSLLVAEAGRHRLWRIPAGSGDPAIVAGTGEAGLIDAAALEALLAQPSGMARLPAGVALVDADASALRVLADDGQVRTLVGQGLFDWGASDGGPESSALQHPLGVAATTDGTSVYVADTFNSLLRVWSGDGLTAAEGTLRTLPVDGLDEPGGLDVLPDGRLVVADTNHHRIVVLDPAMGGLDPLVLDESWIGTVRGGAMSAMEGAEVQLPFAVDPGALAFDLTVGPPVRIDVSATPATLLGPGPRSWALTDDHGSLALTAGAAGHGVLLVEVAVSLCDDLQCSVLRAATRHDLTVGADDAGLRDPGLPDAASTEAPAADATASGAPAPGTASTESVANLSRRAPPSAAR